MLRCVESGRLEILPLEERGMVLEGPQNVTAPYPQQSPASRQRIQVWAYSYPKPCLSFPDSQMGS